jgi:hypothetical protein
MGAVTDLSREIIQTVEQVLQAAASPVVRYKLLKEVLGRLEDDSELLDAYQGVLESSLVQQLGDEQWEDGSWGRLHSVDTSTKQKFGTTEVGVARAVALGLKPTHPILHKAAQRLAQVIETGQVRDRAEKNDRWPTGVRLIAAATLSLIDPYHPSIDPIFDLWLEISKRVFSNGVYDPEVEIAAHKELTGATVKNSYLVFHNKYTYTLMAGRLEELTGQLERSLVAHAWKLTTEIKYFSIPAAQTPTMGKAGQIESWFCTQELLSRFPAWRESSGDVVAWLLAQRDADGWWDFGPRAASTEVLPFSDNWRRKNIRRTDWTTRVLSLLARIRSDN